MNILAFKWNWWSTGVSSEKPRIGRAILNSGKFECEQVNKMKSHNQKIHDLMSLSKHIFEKRESRVERSKCCCWMDCISWWKVLDACYAAVATRDGLFKFASSVWWNEAEKYSTISWGRHVSRRRTYSEGEFYPTGFTQDLFSSRISKWIIPYNWFEGMKS